jgi:hypothetical protein
MFVFILGQLPVPIIAYLNYRVTMRYLSVRRLAKDNPVAKPRQLVLGWWLNNLALVFLVTPALVERRFFVQSHWWLISYAISAGLTITGLLLMDDGLTHQLRAIRRRRRQRHLTSVDR